MGEGEFHDWEFAHLKDIPESERHFADGLLRRILTPASGNAENDGDQLEDDLAAFDGLQRPRPNVIKHFFLRQ